MKVRLFVTSSAAVLSLWLGLTFVHDVNVASYETISPLAEQQTGDELDAEVTESLVALAE